MTCWKFGRGNCSASGVPCSADGSSKLACFNSSSMAAWSGPSVSMVAAAAAAADSSAGGVAAGVAAGGCSSAMVHHPWRNAIPDRPQLPSRVILTTRAQEARVVIRRDRDASRRQHFADRLFTDDLVELILHLPPQRLQPRFRSAPELLRIGLRNDRTNAVLNQGLAILDRLLNAFRVLALRDEVDAHVIQERSAGHFVRGFEIENVDFDGLALVQRGC